MRLFSDDSVEINRSITKESDFSDEETRICFMVILLSNKTEAKLRIPVEGQKKKKECEFVLQTCLMFIYILNDPSDRSVFTYDYKGW